MDDYLRKLGGQAEPTIKDIRFHQHVNYLNAFLKHFGDERVYLVGSTGDSTKLTVPTDHGDADFLIVAGQMKIPVQSIEFRPESTSYCWIRANNIPLKIGQEFMDNGYLKAFILQELHPQLFSMVRAVYLHLSANIDRHGAANKDKTSLGIRSKVGLAHTTYKGIKIHGKLQRYRDNVGNTSNHGAIERAPLNLHTLDAEDLKVGFRIVELLTVLNRTENQDEFHGQSAFFAKLVKEVLEDVTTEGNNQTQLNTVNSEQQYQGLRDDGDGDDYQGDGNDEADGDEGITLQFKKTTNKDFVPAMKIVGKLECMDRWKKRVTELEWAKEKIDDIHGTDMFLIAREAIVSPNPTLDFCLAFGLQEQKLVKGFSKDQKLVYLILKTLRKGCFDYTFELRKMPLKLRTYHMKTVALWTFENGYLSNERDMAEPESILRATNEAVAFLAKAVNSKLLRHYFTEDNLFGNFDDEDFEIISQVCDAIRSATKEEIEASLKRSEITSDKKHLTRDEINILLQLEGDGGKQNNVNRIREGITDAIRGVNSAKKDRQGEQSALTLAVLDFSRLIFQDSQSPKTWSGSAFGNRFKDVQKSIQCCISHEGLIPVNYDAELISKITTKTQIIREFKGIGDNDSRCSILRWAAAVNTEDLTEEIESIIQQIEQFLTCPDDSKDKIGPELKVKLALIFV